MRLKKVKEKMDQAGMQVLLATHPANMNYLTGYDGWSFYVHQGVLVFIDKEEPIWFGREQDSNGAKITTWLKDENIIGYEDDYVQSLVKHPMEFVTDILKDKGYEKANIGLEMDNYYFTAKCYNTLQNELNKADFKDANRLVPLVRQIKSDKELEYMKMAARIVENTMQTAIDNIEEGVREGDAAAKVYEAQIRGTEDFTGDYTAIAPIMPSAERTSTAHLTWTDRRYQKGDVVLLELAGSKNKYHAPLSRTLYIGDPPQDLQDIAKTVVDGLNKTLDFIEPGISCEEVEEKWRESISGSKVVKESRVGYSYGLNYPPDWGEHTASLRPGDKTILKPGMTFHFMPGIWLDKFGFENSEPFYVTEDGCETFVDFPRKLFLK
ncbi:MAG TPA: M24 family metallopeptidase, partial [Halanaerobiales bacterium]|nr:M24 family metallopeptidase [Halanaerobiales bacterium]